MQLWLGTYDLFASARKALFSAQMATGVHRLRNKWSSLLSHLVDNNGDNSADREIHTFAFHCTSSIPSPPLSMYFSFEPFLDCETLFVRNISLCFPTSLPFRTHLLR